MAKKKKSAKQKKAAYKSKQLQAVKKWARKIEACTIEKTEKARARALANKRFMDQADKMAAASTAWIDHKARTGESGRKAHREFMQARLRGKIA